jgi:hypothetical protein
VKNVNIVLFCFHQHIALLGQVVQELRSDNNRTVSWTSWGKQQTELATLVCEIALLALPASDLSWNDGEQQHLWFNLGTWRQCVDS